MLERGNEVFSCFFDVRKAFDTVWIDGLLFKLFSELGIKGRMWLATKDLFTNVKAKVLYAGSLPREIDISQGTGQGRIPGGGGELYLLPVIILLLPFYYLLFFRWVCVSDDPKL